MSQGPRDRWATEVTHVGFICTLSLILSLPPPLNLCECDKWHISGSRQSQTGGSRGTAAPAAEKTGWSAAEHQHQHTDPHLCISTGLFWYIHTYYLCQSGTTIQEEKHAPHPVEEGPIVQYHVGYMMIKYEIKYSKAFCWPLQVRLWSEINNPLI